MLAELRGVLVAPRSDATADDYRHAILEDNAAGKGTASTRLWTFKKLRELYGLDPRLAVFRCLRQLWDSDPVGRPVLAVLCACARDPILRASARVIAEAPLASVVTADDFRDAIRAGTPDRFTPKTLRSVGGNLIATWTQSGHLIGTKTRRRAAPTITPEVISYALVLGRLTGARGPRLFSTPWTELLGLSENTLHDMAAHASRQGWIDFRRVGSVVDVGFTRLLTPAELELLA